MQSPSVGVLDLQQKMWWSDGHDLLGTTFARFEGWTSQRTKSATDGNEWNIVTVSTLTPESFKRPSSDAKAHGAVDNICHRKSRCSLCDLFLNVIKKTLNLSIFANSVNSLFHCYRYCFIVTAIPCQSWPNLQHVQFACPNHVRTCSEGLIRDFKSSEILKQ